MRLIEVFGRIIGFGFCVIVAIATVIPTLVVGTSFAVLADGMSYAVLLPLLTFFFCVFGGAFMLLRKKITISRNEAKEAVRRLHAKSQQKC